MIKKLKQIAVSGKHNFKPEIFPVISRKKTLYFTCKIIGDYDPENYEGIGKDGPPIPDQVTKVLGMSNVLSARIKSMRIGIRKTSGKFLNNLGIFEVVLYLEKWYKTETISMMMIDTDTQEIEACISKDGTIYVSNGTNMKSHYAGSKYSLGLWRMSTSWFGGIFAFPPNSWMKFLISYMVTNTNGKKLFY